MIDPVRQTLALKIRRSDICSWLEPTWSLHESLNRNGVAVPAKPTRTVQLSDDLAIALGVLAGPPPLIPWLSKRESADADALLVIRETGDPIAAAYLAPLLIDKGSRVLRTGLEVLTFLLNRSSPDLIPGLIAAAQGGDHRLGAGSMTKWHALTQQDIERVAVHDGGGIGFLTLASGHRSGYVREAAVRHLTGRTEAFVIPALKARLNDWVTPVRLAAHAAMRTYLTSGHGSALVASLAMLTQLEDCRRDNHQGLLDQVRMVLREPGSRAALLQGVASSDADTRRHAYDVLLAGDGHSPDTLLLGFDSSDPWLRLRAARCVREHAATLEITPFLHVMVEDPQRPIRQEALLLLVEHAPDQADPYLQRFLVDRNPTLRQFARFYLEKRHPGFSAHGSYLTQLPHATGGDVCRCLIGIGETGAPEDAPLLAGYLAHPQAQVRAAAYGALNAVLPADTSQVFYSAFTEKSGAVRRALWAALRKRRGSVPTEVITPHLRHRDPILRRFAVRALAELPLLDALPYLLEALADESSLVSGFARARITKLMQRVPNGYSDISPDQMRRLVLACTHAEPQVSWLVSWYLTTALRPGVWPHSTK